MAVNMHFVIIFEFMSELCKLYVSVFGTSIKGS